MSSSLIQILVETLLYYFACMIVARSHESAPSFLRVLITVLILSFFAGGVRYIVHDIWHSGALLFVISFFVLWFGLGVGFFRTIIATLIVAVLHAILEHLFARGGGAMV